MKELENITFVIPVRIDSEERKTNLDTVLDYLCIYNEVKIIVLEADSERRYNPEIKHSGFSYFFIEDHDPVFHRTRYLNLLLRSAKTPVAGVWDSDVIVSYEQIFESVRRCMNEDTLSYPYDGRFYYVSNEISRSYRDTRNFDIIDQKEYQHFIYHGLHSVGGAFVVNLERYISAGGENENFYGCGPGWYVKTLRENGFNATGYDGNPFTEEISIEMIEDGHVNCRANEYIIQKMLEKGVAENAFIANLLRKNSTLEWFKDTLLFFENSIGIFTFDITE